MKNIEASADTTGSPAEVWALLSDASTWSTWGAWSQVEVEGGALVCAVTARSSRWNRVKPEERGFTGARPTSTPGR